MKPHLFWTHGYRPFVMGGSPNYILGAKLPASGPYKVGNGFEVFVTTSPDGRSIVAEAESGAIVGNSLEEVRKDISSASTTVMKQQVREALEMAKNVEIASPEEFWRTYPKNA